MADEIEVCECRLRRYYGDLQIYDERPVAVQQLDQSGTTQHSAALNAATQMVRIVNNHSAQVRVAVFDNNTTTVDATNAYPIPAGGVIEMHVQNPGAKYVSARTV